MTARQRHRAEIMLRDRFACALAPQHTGWPGEDSKAGPCDGDLRADHILKVSVLLRLQGDLRIRDTRHRDLSVGQSYFIKLTQEEIEADARNGWWLCDRHHGLKDGRKLVVVEEILLPMHFVDFVVDYELGDLAGRELRPRAMPRSRHVPDASGAAETPRRRR